MISYPQQWFIKLSEKPFYVLKPIFKTLKIRVLDLKENINVTLCTFLQNRTKGHNEARKQTGELRDTAAAALLQKSKGSEAREAGWLPMQLKHLDISVIEMCHFFETQFFKAFRVTKTKSALRSTVEIAGRAGQNQCYLGTGVLCHEATH